MRARELALALLLATAYGWLFVFFPRLNNPNELVRVYMARAIAEHGTYAIGRRERVGNRLADVGPLFAEWGYVNDRSLVCDDRRLQGPNCVGALYSGKAPGVSLLAAPIVAAQNVATRALAHRMPTRDEYVLLLRWLLAILPSLALWLMLRRFFLASGVEPPLALVATLAGALGSLSYTFGQMVASHQLSSVALASGWMAAFWPGRESRRANAALLGLSLAASVCIEYQSAPAAMLLGVAWLIIQRPHFARGGAGRLLAFALGALPFAALFVQFHTEVYGAPWRTGYSFLENAGFQQDIAPGFLGISWPTGERIWGSFFSPALGLFFFAPWCALALGALPLAWRLWKLDRAPTGSSPDRAQQGPAHQAAAAAPRRLHRLALPSALAVVLYYVAFQCMHALWRSGWTIGPRYITPIVPFAALAIVLSLQRLAGPARALGCALLAGAGAASIIATGLASMVTQGFPPEPEHPLTEVVLPLLVHGWIPRNLLQGAGVPGLGSALPTLLALLLAVALCLRAPLQMSAGRHLCQRAFALGVALFLLLSLGQWAGPKEGPWQYAAFLSSQWSPPHPPGAAPF